MPSLQRLTRRDPRWEEEGPSARREYQRQQVRELIAFATSVIAVVAAVVLWATRLGAMGIGHR